MTDTRARGRRCAVSAAISVAFGCPFEGDVDPGRVAALARAARRGRGRTS